MVMIDSEGHCRLVMEPEKPVSWRQAAPSVYDMTTVAYAARPEFVLHASSMFEGKVRAIVVPSERALDIDTELDFKLAELLLSEMPPRSA